MLQEEVAAWERANVRLVVSLLEPREEGELELRQEASACAEAGIHFVSLPIPDRGVPQNPDAVARSAVDVASALRSNAGVVIHCRAGIGRTALFAGCVLHALGTPTEEAFAMLGRARGVPVPDTADQEQWVHAFARGAKNVL